MKLIELRRQKIGAEILDRKADDGKPLYQLFFEDRETGDVIFCIFDETTRDVLITNLTGNIVVASELPPPRIH